MLADSYWRQGLDTRYRANAMVFVPHLLVTLAVDILPPKKDDQAYGLGPVPTVQGKHHHVTVLFNSPAKAKHSNAILELIHDVDPKYLTVCQGTRRSKIECVRLPKDKLPRDMHVKNDDGTDVLPNHIDAIVLRFGENDKYANSLVGHFVRQSDDAAAARSDYSQPSSVGSRRVSESEGEREDGRASKRQRTS